jgi:hypothetical protein
MWDNNTSTGYYVGEVYINWVHVKDDYIKGSLKNVRGSWPQSSKSKILA